MEDAFGGVIAPFLVEAAAELTNLEGEMRGLREESGGYRCDPSPCRYPAVTQPLPSRYPAVTQLRPVIPAVTHRA